jgi:hypothetical protein
MATDLSHGFTPKKLQDRPAGAARCGHRLSSDQILHLSTAPNLAQRGAEIAQLYF